MKLENIILILIVGAIVMFDMCDRRAQNNSHLNDIKSVVNFNERENDQVIKDSNLHAKEIETMKQNLVSEKTANELLKKELEGYKKLNSFIKAELITSINNLKVDFSVPEKDISDLIQPNDSTIHKDTVLKYFTRLPRQFSFNDDWFSLSGRVNKSGVLFDTLSFINKFDITVGYKKGKRFWSKSEPVVELKSYNPYTSVPYINNIVVAQEKTPWYYSRLAFFGYGVLSGYGISKLKTN